MMYVLLYVYALCARVHACVCVCHHSCIDFSTPQVTTNRLGYKVIFPVPTRSLLRSAPQDPLNLLLQNQSPRRSRLLLLPLVEQGPHFRTTHQHNLRCPILVLDVSVLLRL